MNWNILVPFFAYLALILVIGAYSYRIVSRTAAAQFAEEYYLGSRSLGAWVLALSFAASLGSAGAFLGTPAKAYESGYAWLIVGAAQTGSVFVGLGLLGKRIAIIGRRLGAYTIPQLLSARFPGRVMRYYVPLIILVFVTIYMVPQIIGGARVLEAMAGVPYGAGVIVVGLFTVLYTTLGGFRAASFTDLLQGLFMAAGAFALCALVVAHAGGLGPITDTLVDIDPALISPTADGALGFGFLFSVGWLLLGVALLSLPHAAVRGLAFRDAKALHNAMLIGTVAAFAFTSIMWFVGAAGHAIVGDIDTPDHVVPLVIKELFPSMLAGIFLAVPFAAIMSTVDSMLLVVSSSLIEDIVVKARGSALDHTVKKRLNMASTGAIGALVIVLALFPPDFLLTLVFYAIGGLASSLLVPILAGLYWPRANSAGAIAASVGGGVAYLAFDLWVPDIGSFHTLTWSLASSLLLMIGFSLATPPAPRAVLQTFWGRPEKATGAGS